LANSRCRLPNLKFGTMATPSDQFTRALWAAGVAFTKDNMRQRSGTAYTTPNTGSSLFKVGNTVAEERRSLRSGG
jgi:hypothetical protein